MYIIYIMMYLSDVYRSIFVVEIAEVGWDQLLQSHRSDVSGTSGTAGGVSQKDCEGVVAGNDIPGHP